jgi:SAM-dependent methyltransferase
MTTSRHPSIQDIDFGQLYRQHMAAVGRAKPPSVWDARADGIKPPSANDPYTRAFVQRMDLSGCETLLDVGCGAGNIALAVAPSLRTVVGLDYSPRMLALFQQNAQAQGVPDARAILRSWTDDWADVPECDVVVASRSTAVMDMEQALGKLHDKARKRVYLTSLVGGRFSDVTLQAAIGRPVPPALPDYIYVVNILHAQGIQARVDFIAAAGPRAVYRRFEDLLAQVQAREGEITEAEQVRLRDWFSAQASAKPAPSASWAMVSWEK